MCRICEGSREWAGRASPGDDDLMSVESTTQPKHRLRGSRCDLVKPIDLSTIILSIAITSILFAQDRLQRAKIPHVFRTFPDLTP
jgi:hypothetical protein